MELVATLPHLATLEWWERASTENAHCRRPHHIGPTCNRGAACPGGAGLRLLHAEKCSFESLPAMPSSLQVLSLLSADGGNSEFLRERLDLVLAPCASLRELYILQSFLDSRAPLGLPAIAASCPALQVLVLHVFAATEPWVSHRHGCAVPA